ncbi:DHA2 family efflux MFS transporter permease subunit [Pigmentiphaga humi]
MMVPLIIGCALFMQMLDSTVITTALPAMGHSLGEDPVKLNVAITAYLLSAAVFVPICGWAADRFGARRVFTSAIVLFTLSSTLCGVSHTLGQIVAGRILQGFAGAMMVPVGRIVLLRSVPKSELVRAMSFLSMPALLGPIFGPAVGGFLVEYASWRWIFFMNLPIGVLGVVLTLRYIKEEASERVPQPLDVVGFLLTAVCMGTLVFCFEAVGHGVLSSGMVAGLLALGCLCGYLYLRHAERSPNPILDFRLLKIPTFSVALLGGNLCRLAVGAVPFLLAMQLQIAFGMGPFAAGLLTFAGALGALMMKMIASPIIRRFGFRRTLLGNAFLCGLSILGCILFTPVTPHLVIIVVLMLGGLSRSLQLTAVNSLSYADIRSDQMARATGLASAVQQLTISLGVALAAFVLKCSMALRGSGTLEDMDVTYGYLVIGISMMLSVTAFRKLAPNAGAEVSGKR